MGSCVDNVRILVLISALADALGVDISDLPVAGSAPEWYSEKAVTIGTYFVASGVTTHLGPMPPITGSMNVVNLLTSGLKDVVGATFAVEPDPEKAAVFCAGPSKTNARRWGWMRAVWNNRPIKT
jgi:carbon-monoxide dehydrogenase catalytic subunit